MLLLHGELHADVIEKNGTPADQDTCGREIHEPVKYCQGIVAQSQEAEKHEDREQSDADVGCAPGCRSEENLGGLALECQAVQNPRARQQRLVARTPSTRDDDGIDQAGNGLDTGGAGRDNEGTLGGCAAFIAKTRVVAGDQHAHDEYSEHVEEQDAGKNLLACSGDGTTGVLGLGGCHGDGLDTSEGKDSAGHDTPKAEKLAPVASGDILDERAWVLPVLEADAFSPWNPAQIDDKTEDDQKDDQKNLEDSKDILDFAEDF